MNGMKKIVTILCVVILMFSLVACSHISRMKSSSENTAEVESLEDCSYLPVCYSYGNISYWLFISVSEKSVLTEQIQSLTLNQWNATGSEPAYYFLRKGESDAESNRINIYDIYNSDGQLLGVSYESTQSGGILNSSSGGYAVIHTRPDDAGILWSVVIDENGKIIKEVSSEDYIIKSWNQDGYSLIWKDGYYGYIDKKGNIAIDVHFTSATDFDENGLAAVCSVNAGERTVCLIDTNGDAQSEYEGMYLVDYTDGLLILRSVDTGGYIIVDESGNSHEIETNIYDRVSLHKFEDGTVFIYCVNYEELTTRLINIESETIQSWEGIDTTCVFGDNDTIVILNADGYYGVYDQNLEEIIAPEYEFLTPILGGSYYSVIWSEDDSSDYYVGIIDAQGNICVYACISGEQTQAYEGDDFVNDYELIYEWNTVYQSGSSAWGTALTGVQSLLKGDTENCIAGFLTTADGSVGGTGMSEDQFTELVETVGEELASDYGDYHVLLYVSTYQDVYEEYSDSISGELHDADQTIEAVCCLKGNYLVRGSTDRDGDSDLEDNEFEVTVVCVDGTWYLWSF